jgi:hypothetical protein
MDAKRGAQEVLGREKSYLLLLGNENFTERVIKLRGIEWRIYSYKKVKF